MFYNCHLSVCFVYFAKIIHFFLIFKRNCFICRIDVFSFQKHYFEFFSCHETLRNKIKYQFVRHAYQSKQKTQKQIENFHFSIYAINSVCEIEKTSFISHKFFVSKFMFEFAITLKTVILLKRSNFSFFTFEIMSKSTKKSTTCRRCNKIFNFNNKFHEHIRQYHVRKSIKNSDFRIFASKFTYKFIEKSTNICSSVSFVSQKSFVFFATSKNQIFWFSINFKSVVVSTRSNFSIATYKINSKSLKNAIVNCSFIFSISFFQISIRKHQKFHNEFYFILNDLNRMFYEKSKSFDLRQHHNRRFFSQNFDFRQFSQSCFSISKKFYFIMYNLSRMFDEKFKKKIYFKVKITNFFKHFQIKCKSSSISNLQSIRNRQLIRFRKIQNRKIRNNTCLRNQFALFSTKTCLKN